MNECISDCDQADSELLTCDVCDEALEIAASIAKDTVMTLPSGFSVNVMCCSSD